MMTGQRLVQALVLAAGLGPATVVAQTSPEPAAAALPQPGVAVDGGGIPFRRWDVAVSAGLHAGRDDMTVRPYAPFDSGDNWRAGLSVQVDVGRYWTSHVKTEASYAHLTSIDVYGNDVVAVPGGTAYAPTKTDVARQYIGAAMTYQFFDNVFAHPYVSGGLRLSIFDRHTVRAATAWYSDRATSREYPVLPLDVRSRDLLVRPFVAAGFKSYFDERAFLRSEVSTLFSGRGLEHWTVRLGAGIDF